jgi:hypothetical protein
VKIRKPTNCGITNQMPSCAFTMSTSDSDPAIITTPIRLRPSDTS